MDIELARTFLEIVSTGSFIKAADRLHVAQTTVSARVRLLEQQLGRPLFVRNKAGASLTPAGEQFLRYRSDIRTTLAARKTAGRGTRRTPRSFDGRKRGQLVAAASARVGQDDAALASRHSASRSCRRSSRSNHARRGRTRGYRDHVRAPASTGFGDRLADGGRARTGNNRPQDVSRK